MLQHFVLEFAAFEKCVSGIAQLSHRRRARARGRLVTGRDDAADAIVFVDGPQRHARDDGDTIGIGDDAAVASDGLWIDLGNHQRNFVVHAEGR
jgi:hypothetical protein